MTDGHCFISYSHADGLDFVTKLADELEGGHPFTKVWFEKREMVAGRDDWDDQLAKAIRDSKCLLFVMSKDSTGGHSNCKDEWTWALKYKKPVICLWISNDAEDQFRLNSRQKIDFTSNFDQGLAKLRKTIAFLDSPEGELEELNHRLNDANRDLRRASDADRLRIQADIDDLKKQIDIQQNIVNDPEAAKRETEQKIQNGLERERQPQMPTVGIKSTKFINPPPGIAPNYFQDRTVETKQVFDFLKDDAQRLLTIVGRGGVGKTAMTCRLLKHLENSAIPEDVQKAFGNLQSLKVDGIVYLSESGSHRINFTNIFYDLCKLLPKETAQEMDNIYKNPQDSTESKMRALLEKFTGDPIVLLLDNFEPLVDNKTFEITDAELNEALLALLNGTHTSVNIVITTRVAPKKLNLVQPGRQRSLDLDDGLESPYAENILRDMDSDGRIGLKAAPDELLNRARERTRGYPRALEALFAILASDRYTSLEELLAKPTPENVVQELVGEAFNRLDTNAQKVMQALAVYNRPVTPAAVDFVLAPHILAIDSAPILQRLANMHFARKESGRFYLHPVDREFAFGLIENRDWRLEISDSDESQETDSQSPITNLQSPFTQHDLLNRAANYFAQARKPREEWKKLDDLSAQLAEFDLRCAAGDYDTAASVLLEIDFDYLLLWGHYRLVIDLRSKMEGKINDSTLARINIGYAGKALINIGKFQHAINNFEKALELSRTANNRQAEEVYLIDLGNAYEALGDARKAIEFHEQALVISREIRDRRGEGNALGSLGIAYASLGDTRKAIEFQEQALVIALEIGDRRGEGASLGNLGLAYRILGDAHKALEFQEQALVIAREIGDKQQEGNMLGSLGSSFKNLGEIQKALDYQKQALVIAQEIGDKSNEGGLSGNIGNRYLELGDFKTALDYYRQAVDISSNIGSKGTQSVHIENIGHVLIELEKVTEARKSFQEAIEIADGISYSQTQNSARWGLAKSHLSQNDLTNARATIEAALRYDVPQNNHNISALHGIIALRQGDEVTARGAFVRAIGQADEILSKTAEYYDALDAKGLALCGLILCRGAVSEPNGDGANTGRGDPAPTVDDAIETFRKARKIAPHAGVVKRNLRLFDELMKCEGGEILKDVRNAVEGK